jgi:hypothetical protein
MTKQAKSTLPAPSPLPVRSNGMRIRSKVRAGGFDTAALIQ